MLAKDRRNEILKTMRTNGGMIKMTDIINTYGVSHETARRDIEALQDKKYVKRIHGGAILNSKMRTLDFFIPSNADELGADAREAIGRMAASLINEGESVLLANGTTVLEVAKHLKNYHNLTIITNSLPVINELIDTTLDIYVLGGKIDSNELNMSGNLGLRSLQGIYADKAFIGAGGVTLEYGVSDYAIQDESLREEIIKRAGTVILVAHSEKFGNNAFSLGIPLKNIDIVVTDKGLSSEYRRGLTELGINVFLADGEDVYVDD